ncbi:transglycosylase domain-containing protein [Dermabacter vaginalis]|uniref:Penicillin-binding protein n=1 Tax=Dermabacter vaginalis TaxID=1630135 RepID=A0ABX6A2T9_9MICO|nr:transglycosylase domain-containing protein [Dermabacter vaginalis]QEU11189.1 penicillin-binding protein [Dermabacter vaginalis]
MPESQQEPLVRSNPSEPTTTLTQAFTGVAGLLAVCALAGVLLAAFALPVVTAMSAAAKDGVNLFNSLPSELDVAPLNEASRIEAADGSLLATFYSENRIMVPLDKIDEDLQHAVIAVEDRRFYQHNGFDPQGTFRALASNLAGNSLQGGSTLTQQYVKNALLMDAFQRGDDEAIQAATESSLIRKLREAKIAISLEKKWSKDEILNGYLNVAQFGPSQYGVETAAQHYFSKSAADLTPGEAALLAGITNSPNGNDPVKHPKNATKRRNQVLYDMYQLGYVSKDDYEAAKNQPIEDMLKVTDARAGCSTAGGSGFFCDYVTRSLLNDPAFGKTKEDRRKLLYGGGLTIKTTLDPARQKIAEDIVNRKVPADSESGFGHAIVSVEPGTGNIRVMAQNRTYNPYKDAKPGETSLNYTAPKYLGGGNGFPVGSTFKPFVLTTFLTDGGSIWDTVGRGSNTFNNFPAKCLRHGKWREPAGWRLKDSGRDIHGSMSVLDATKFSINTAYANIALRTDLCSIAETTRALGAIPGKWDDSIPANKEKPVNDILGADLSPATQVIGEINIPAVSMAAAYAAFAAEGNYCKPQAIEAVVDRNGKELPFTKSQCSQVIKPEVANAVAWTLMQGLSDPKGTGKGKIIPGHDAGGKSGTSGKQYHTWYVGFTKNLSTAVWFGNPTANKRPTGVKVDGQPLVGNVWGRTVSLPTWHEFMIKAHEGLPSIPFPPKPEGVQRAPHTPDSSGSSEGGDEGAPAPAPAQTPEQAPAPDQGGAPQEDTQEEAETDVGAAASTPAREEAPAGYRYVYPGDPDYDDYVEYEEYYPGD